MDIIRNGARGSSVRSLQIALNHIRLGVDAMPITGLFDDALDVEVRRFQQANGLTVDGIVGPKTWAEIERKRGAKFMVSLHAGHGGIDPFTKKYTTAGKQFRHPGTILHDQQGNFFEGVENRLICEAVADELRARGIFVLVTHHPYKDDGHDLGQHFRKTLPYIREGYKGYTEAYHTNAIDVDENSPEKVAATRGGFVYTTRGVTGSDPLAQRLLELWQERFGNWVRLDDDRRGKELGKRPTLSSDVEANFAVLRDIEGMDDKSNLGFHCLLPEFGFMTSKTDALFIVNPSTRAKRIDASVQLALWYKKLKGI